MAKNKKKNLEQQVIESIKKDKIKFIDLNFTDIFGTLKGVTVPAERLESMIKNGKWFDGSSIKGFARIMEADMFLIPDLKTYAVWPVETNPDKRTARFICDVYNPDGTPFEGSPRNVLHNMCRKVHNLGCEFMVAPELEFFMFNDDESRIPVPCDIGGYFESSVKDVASDVRKDIMNAMASLGIKVEMAHHEVAVGQQEIGFEYGPALRTADNTVTVKNIIKSIAHNHKLVASFMPKPVYGINGSGMHTHFSLSNRKNKNTFYDSKGRYKLSSLAEHFIAGILDNVNDITAVLNPIVNSYKRLTPGYEAPVYVCWADSNRSALIRVPRISKDNPNSARAEIRSPDPSCNPYLAFSVLLAAGLDGVKKNLQAPDPAEENIYKLSQEELEDRKIHTLPGSLNEAIANMERSVLAKECLGTHLFQQYIDAKKQEWEKYRIQVTDLEREMYLKHS